MSKYNFYNINQCDQFSKLSGIDLQDLILEMESIQLPLRDVLGLPQDITIGLELEFENAIKKLVKYQLNLINTKHQLAEGKKWELKRDASVQSLRFFKSCGGEIVSPILTDEKNNWLQLKEVCDMLKELQAITQDKAGGHIHFGSQILGRDVEMWKLFLQMWTIYEKIIYRFSYGQMLGNRKGVFNYASPIGGSIYKELDKIKQCESFGRIRKLLPSSRYRAVNFNNISYGDFEEANTIEFRCFNGTVEANIWQNNVGFIANLLLYCQSKNYDQEYLDYKLQAFSVKNNNRYLFNEIYLQDALELSDMIFTNNIDKMCFLKQYFKSFSLQKLETDNKKTIRL